MGKSDKSPQLYKHQQQTHLLGHFVKTNGGLYVASNTLSHTASMTGGRLEEIKGLSSRDVILIAQKDGPPLIYISSQIDTYRDVFAEALHAIGYGSGGFEAGQHVDHALARSLGRGKFDMILMSLVDGLPNTIFGGGVEKNSKDRVIVNKGHEVASIFEMFKMLEVAPVSKGDSASDIITAFQNLASSGLCSQAGVSVKDALATFIRSIESGSNNIVKDMLGSDFDAVIEEANKIK